MNRFLLLVLIVLPLAAQEVVGSRVHSSGTYANRPGTPATGTVYIVLDDASAGACAGGGSAQSQCRYNGSTWTALGGTAGGGGGITALTGDVTASGTGSVATTLSTVNSNVGSCGDATHVGQVTLDGKGRATGCTAVAISGGGGSSTTNALQTLANLVVRTSATVLTLLPNASAGTPYPFTIGATYAFVASPTVTITGGSGSDTAYLYVDSAGTLTVGKNNLTMACAGACTVVSGVTSFPEGSIHIATWTASSATWDSSGGTNFRDVGSTTRVIAGSGCTVTFTGTAYSVSCSGSGITCDSGVVTAATDLVANSTGHEITIMTAVPGATLYAQSTLLETTTFASGSITATTVSMGRTGANNSEMTGALAPLMVPTSFPFIPLPPVFTGTYNVVLNFTSTGANLGNGSTSNFTDGVLAWRVCHY